MVEDEPTDGIALLKGKLGEALIATANSYIFPFVWGEIGPAHRKPVPWHNGTCFLLDTGSATILVTAAHVFTACRDHLREHGSKISVQVGELVFDPVERLIAYDETCDIATFSMTTHEAKATGRTPIGGSQTEWPPPPPEIRSGVFVSGFPGIERTVHDRQQLDFGIVTVFSVVESVTDRKVVCRISGDDIVDVAGLGLPPDDYDPGGMSGAPVFAVLESAGVLSWFLAGVCSRASRESGYLLVSRADSIMKNGTLG